MYSFSLDKEKNILNIEVFDTKNQYSFLLHSPGTDRHQRNENPIMGETTQRYSFSIPMDEVKQRVAE